MKPGLRTILAALVCLNAVVFLPDVFVVFTESITIQNDRISPDLGLAFRVVLRHDEVRGRFLESRIGAWDIQSVALHENARALTFAGPGLRAVRETGGGVYTQRGPTLIFSAFDNSDPRANGRAYTFTVPLSLRTWIKLVALAISGLLLVGWLVWIGGRERQALLSRFCDPSRPKTETPSGAWSRTAATLCAGLVGLVAVNYLILDATHMLPGLKHDSAGYFNASVLRTVGYPLFVHTVIGALGDVRWLVPVQLNLLLGGCLLLGWAVGRAFQAPLAGWVTGLSLLATKPILYPSWMVLSEALFIPLVCIHAATALLTLHTRSRTVTVAAGISAGLAIAVRPAGYSLLLGLLVLLWFLRDDCKRLRWWLIGGCAAVLLLSATAQYVRAGLVGTQSAGGLALVGHVAPIITEDIQTEHPELTRRIAHRIRPLVGDIDALSFPHEHWSKTTALYNQLLWEHVVPEIRATVDQTAPHLNRTQKLVRTNALAMHIAIAAIRERPTWYLKHVLAHYFGLWRTMSLDYPPLRYQVARSQQRTLSLLQGHRDSYVPPFDISWYQERRAKRGQPERPGDQWLDRAWTMLPFFSPSGTLIIFAVSLVALAGCLRTSEQSVRLQCLAYVSLLIHSNIAFVASVQAGLERYTQPLKPLVIIFAVGATVVLVERLRKELALRWSLPAEAAHGANE